MRNRMLWFATGTAVLLVAAATAVPRPSKAQGSRAKPPAGTEAPEFTLMDTGGKSVSLKDYRGKKVVILDFWATWCGPCRGTMPLLQKYYERNKSKGVEVLSINEQESGDRVRNFIAQAGYTFRVLLDTDGGTQAAYRVYGIPTLFVIDKDGSLRYKHVGYRPDLDQHLEQVTAPLL